MQISVDNLNTHYKSVRDRIDARGRAFQAQRREIARRRVEEAASEQAERAAQAAVVAIKERFKGDDLRPKGRVLVSDIVRKTAEHLDVPASIIVSTRRRPHEARARKIVYFLSREMCNVSLPGIGRSLSRDHTTVLHGIRAVEQELSGGDEGLRADIQAIREMVAADVLVVGVPQ